MFARGAHRGVIRSDHRRHLLRRGRQAFVERAKLLRLVLEVLGARRRAAASSAASCEKLGNGILVRRRQLRHLLAELVVLTLGLLEARAASCADSTERSSSRSSASSSGAERARDSLDRRQERGEALVAVAPPDARAATAPRGRAGARGRARGSVRWKGQRGRGEKASQRRRAAFCFRDSKRVEVPLESER